MSTRTLTLPLVLGSIWVLNSCAGNDAEAVHHQVMAEMIQREKLPESRINISSIRFATPDECLVIVKVLESSGGERTGETKTMRCTVKREAGRWAVQEVSPMAGEQ